GKVAIVTGASKGIGESIPRRLAAEGAAVVVNYSTSQVEAERVVADITRDRRSAVAIQANVANNSHVERLFVDARDTFRRLDILVNNAGVYEFAPIEKTTPELFHKIFDINVLGLLLATKEAIKHFGPNGGSIINISSVAAASAPAEASVYSATKGA